MATLCHAIIKWGGLVMKYMDPFHVETPKTRIYKSSQNG